MKILQVCTYSTGGAAKAALLLHRQLLDNGIDASLLFLETSLQEKGVHSMKASIGSFRFFLGKVWNKFYPKFRLRSYPTTPELYSFPKAFFDITELAIYKQADVVHLHWTPRLVDLPSFFKKNNKPVIWTLHDQYLLTGGAHCAVGFPFGAFSKLTEAYRSQLEQLLEKKNVQFTVPSNWLLGKVSADEILGRKSIHLLPNGLQPNVFTIKDKLASRKKLGIPENKKVILFVADYLDRKLKGMDSLVKVAESLRQSTDENLFFLIAGKGAILSSISSPYKHLGYVESESEMSDCYNAADVFLIPSLEESLSYTVMESLFCGTPAVAFNVGGISDLLIHEKNGFFSEVGDERTMSSQVKSILSGAKIFDPQEVRSSVVKQFDINKVSQKFIELYHSVIE